MRVPDPDALLAIAREYPGTHVYRGELERGTIYQFSFDQPRAVGYEFLKLLVFGQLATITYQAPPERASRTFGDRLDAGASRGLLLQIRLALEEHHARDDPLRPMILDASDEGAPARIIRDFCDAGERILHRRTH